MIQLDATRTQRFLDAAQLDAVRGEALKAHQQLLDRSGPGHDFLGWLDLPERSRTELLNDLVSTATEIQENADVLLCIGIGGSYLGAQAVIQALTPAFGALPGPEVHFLGHHLGGAYSEQLLSYLDGKSVYVNVISKSGTTLEPAVAFRVVRDWMSERFENVDDRIIVTTDPSKGALNEMQRRHGYKKYEIPPDVGGRFSVLTPVGLLPIAAAGVDIADLLAGAADEARRLENPDQSDALEYASVRNALLRSGYTTEVMAAFDPRLAGLQGWWQQLYGESEGKEKKGLYPDAVSYTTDLHSLGQYVQDGQRVLLETFLMIERDETKMKVPAAKDSADGLDYLAGRSFHDINEKAYQGTAEAHADGGVPNMTVWLDTLTPSTIGEAIYFFEHAVAISGYILGINPFDQPGVEAYKKNMFRLLGRP